MTDRIRIAVLGCSAIARRCVIPAILKSGRLKLAYAASRSPEKAGEFSEKFGCAPCAYQDVLSRKDIDAVYVSLPVGMHADWGKKIVQAGKHLIMEKTFTHDLRSGKQIIDLARRKKVIAMEALVYVYHPFYRKIQSLIRDGAIGKVRQIEASFGFPFLPDQDIRHNWDLGGGAMLDALIYPLSFSLTTIGRKWISCSGGVIRDKDRSVDCRGFLQINWNDCAAHVSYGFGFMYQNNFSVWGDTGIISGDRVFSRPPDMPGEIQIARQGRNEAVAIEAADHFELMMNGFADKIAGKDSSGIDEGADILGRLGVISRMRQAFVKNKKRTVQFSFRP